MAARTYWNSYVESQGGAAKVAQRLGIPYPTIACVCNGSRGIGKALARRMAASDPALDESILIWVEAGPSKSDDDSAGSPAQQGEVSDAA